MTVLEIRAKQFWSAAHFLRRAPNRDHAIAVKILRQVARATGPVQCRAATLLREIDNGTDQHSPRAS
jgi:hypothetical protein